MADLAPQWLAVAIFAAASVAVGAVVLYQNLKPKPMPPRGWTHVGIHPDRADELLDLLGDLWPGLVGGTITWVEKPWPDDLEPKWAIVSQVTDFDRHGMKVSRGPGWARRIIHEVDHLRRGSATEGDGKWIAEAEAYCVTHGFVVED